MKVEGKMKLWQYTTTVVLSVMCVGLSAAIIITSKSNLAIQEEIQGRQQKLNNGVLGQQAQQITGNILQDMAAVAAKNEKMRKLLSQYGYNIPAAPQSPSKKTAVQKTPEEI
jgi:hypothetical protein